MLMHGKTYSCPYWLADGIYPQLSIFVTGFAVATIYMKTFLDTIEKHTGNIKTMEFLVVNVICDLYYLYS